MPGLVALYDIHPGKEWEWQSPGLVLSAKIILTHLDKHKLNLTLQNHGLASFHHIQPGNEAGPAY